MLEKKITQDKKNILVVYTALFGDYDDLIDPPEKFKGCDFVCFTDQNHLKSDVWEIRVVEECDLPPNMMNRKYKINPHLFLADYRVSLYIDSNIRLLSSPFGLVSKYMLESNLSAPMHPLRVCLYEEGAACLSSNKAPKERILSQLETYQHKGFPKSYGLTEMNIIIRKHLHKDIVRLMELWWLELNTQSQRDQLSFMYVVWLEDLKFKKMKENARTINPYFFGECHRSCTFIYKIRRKLKKMVHNVIRSLKFLVKNI
jgi:hypothetical protein